MTAYEAQCLEALAVGLKFQPTGRDPKARGGTVVGVDGEWIIVRRGSKKPAPMTLTTFVDKYGWAGKPERPAGAGFGVWGRRLEAESERIDALEARVVMLEERYR